MTAKRSTQGTNMTLNQGGKRTLAPGQVRTRLEIEGERASRHFDLDLDDVNSPSIWFSFLPPMFRIQTRFSLSFQQLKLNTARGRHAKRRALRLAPGVS